MESTIDRLKRQAEAGTNQQEIYDLLLTCRLSKSELEKQLQYGFHRLSSYIRLMVTKRVLLKDETNRPAVYYSNPDKPVEISTCARRAAAKLVELAEIAAARKSDAEKEAKGIPLHTTQVNEYTRVIKLMDKRPLNSTMPRKKASGSKYVSMGSGMSMFKNWE